MPKTRVVSVASLPGAMRRPGSTVRMVCAALFLMAAGRADAQVFEIVGVRAQGMGGAFVAVADDATATWWNPAGLATGKLFSLTIDYDWVDDPGEPPPSGPARRDAATGFAAAFPSLAVSYYQFRVSEAVPAPSGGARLLALSINQFGTTVGQSIGNHFVVGTTVKILRAGQAISLAPPDTTGTGLLDAAEDIDVDRESKTDVDLGVMAALGVLRLGVTAKNLFKPTFGEDDEVQFTLQRQTRAGIAIVKGGLRGLVSSMNVAADMDVLRTATVNGDVRRFASGIELWMWRLRTGVRSGLSLNTVGEKNLTGSVGLTIVGPFGLYFDSALIYGSDSDRNGLSLGASLTF